MFKSVYRRLQSQKLNQVTPAVDHMHCMREMKEESEKMKFHSIILGSSHATNYMSEKSTPQQELSNPCNDSSVTIKMTAPRQHQYHCPSSVSFILLILAIQLAMVTLIALCELELGDCELEYKLKYDFDCDALPSSAVNTIEIIYTAHTPALNFTPTCLGVSQTSMIGYDCSPLLTATAQAIGNENRIKYGPHIHTHAHSTAPAINRSDRIYPTGVG